MTYRLLSLGLALAALGLGPQPASGQCLGPRDTPLVRRSLVIHAEWLSGRLGEQDLVILHVDDERAGYEAGHIPGARYFATAAVPRPDQVRVEGQGAETLAERFRRLGVSNNSRVVLYGPPLAVARVFLVLDLLGYGDRASILQGGLAAWRAAGFPLSGSEPAIVSGDLEPRVEAWRSVSADWLQDAVGKREIVIVDARSQREFEAGHIPSASQLDWRLTLEGGLDAGSEESPRLRSIPELRRLFRLAGIEAAEDVVFYSDSGGRAAHLYFVARYLGYTPRIVTRSPGGSGLDGS